jgi:hypothetical protein
VNRATQSSGRPRVGGNLPVGAGAGHHLGAGRRRPDVDAEVRRIRALLEHAADAIDIALDSDWRVAIDVLLDLSDEIRAEFLP